MSARRRPFVIGISGGTASGKTMAALKLAELLTDLNPAVLHGDHYFRDFTTLPPAERQVAMTANRPESTLLDAMRYQAESLIAGRPVSEPWPGTRLAARGSLPATIEPGDVVILEGLFVLWDEQMRELMNLKIFMDADDDERVLRRITRDIAERGGTLERVVSWYRHDVAPNYKVYTGPGKRLADIVIPNNTSCEVALGLVAAGVRQMAGR